MKLMPNERRASIVFTVVLFLTRSQCSISTVDLIRLSRCRFEIRKRRNFVYVFVFFSFFCTYTCWLNEKSDVWKTIKWMNKDKRDRQKTTKNEKHQITENKHTQYETRWKKHETWFQAHLLFSSRFVRLSTNSSLISLSLFLVFSIERVFF